ncbi:MAG: hypothetical protein JJT88_00710 [Gammaproteobacteria bacterium]|nr:hypothetical protein [Gammaproteobacteria bacterium]
MRLFFKILLGLFAALILATIYVLNPRLPSPSGEHSATLYQPGSLGIARQPLALTDPSRPTNPNGNFKGSPVRELNGYLWIPDRQEHKPFPLIIYSHGFMSSVAEPQYLVDFLVPKGYAIVAVDYPLTHGGAPGGANPADVIHQPGDVSFLIDALLARNDDEQDSLHGMLDPARIAAVGLSLGGLTTQFAAYHRDLRDPRLSAAVSIAGPSSFLEAKFFETASLPFLMIAGSADAIIPYGDNATPIPDKVDNGQLVTLHNGSHVGFADVARIYMRWLRHPDKPLCPLLLRSLERQSDEAEAVLAPDPDLGISTAGELPCAMEDFERAMRPADQQMFTRLALYAFLERTFAHSAARRQEMEHFLTEVFALENPEVSVR